MVGYCNPYIPDQQPGALVSLLNYIYTPEPANIETASPFFHLFSKDFHIQQAIIFGGPAVCCQEGNWRLRFANIRSAGQLGVPLTVFP